MLSDWWLHLFNDDPVGLIPACVCITTCFDPVTTVAHAESNSHFSRRNPTTVALYVGNPVDVYVGAMVYDAVNGGWIVALFTVKSEVPPLTTACAALYAKVTHVHHAKVGISLYLDEVANLVRNKIIIWMSNELPNT